MAYFELALALSPNRELRSLTPMGVPDHCDPASLRAGRLREDYDPVTRSLLPGALAQFYEGRGFEAVDSPDHLSTMLAFMAQLAALGQSEDVVRAQLRFLNVHLVPTLTAAIRAVRCAEARRVLRRALRLALLDGRRLMKVLITGPP